MEKTNEGRTGTRYIPTNSILSGNKKDIENLILSISKQYNVSVEEAAYALQNALMRFTGGR